MMVRHQGRSNMFVTVEMSFLVMHKVDNIGSFVQT